MNVAGRGFAVPRRLVWTLLVTASFALPGVAQAHGGGNFIAAETTAVPTIDGVVNTDEWANTTYTVRLGTFGTATVRFVHSATDLYIGVTVQEGSPGVAPSFDVYFDNDHDGANDPGDDGWHSFVDGGGQDLYFDRSASGVPGYRNDDPDGDGSNDTVAEGRFVDGGSTFELKHPLCSNDTLHDICPSLGQKLGVDFRYDRGTGAPDGVVYAPAPDLFNPSDGWADLALAPDTFPLDTVAPVVSVTAPEAGSVVRGTVEVAASASDNIGVTAVDFRYFGGELPYVELGTDTDPPYTATFDSTAVENTALRGGTVYAVAHDAAGNTTTVGNGVTIDNTPPTGTVSLLPVADTFVAKGAPDSNFGTLDYADVYGGANTNCVLAQGRSYTLMRFDLSSIPAGVTITDARLEMTTRAGWAQDGDPAHWAIFLSDDSWQENQVTWKTRPVDGVTTEGGTAYSRDDYSGPDIRQSPLSFGAADVWRNGCNADPDPVGNQAKVFPSTTDGFPGPLPMHERG